MMRAFFSLYTTNLFLVGGTGLLTTYLALYLGKQGVSTFWIGMLTSLYYLGLMLGAKVAYHFIRSVGHIRTFSASTAVVIACIAAHGVGDDIYLWLGLRLLVGVGMMSNYMVLESWLNEQSDAENRGQVFSFYMTTSYLGMVAGQFALSQFPELDYSILFLVCIAVAVGLVPISITRRIHPKPLKPIKVSMLSFVKVIPQSLTGIFCAGMINGSFYGLSPLFASKAGFSAEDIALFMSITVVAGLVAQWPMGILSDKVRRSMLLRFNAVMICIVSLALFLLPIEPLSAFVLTFVFGLFAFTLYPLASALANSRVSDEERVGVSSALLIAFGIGAGIGSALLAQLMTFFGHQSLYGAISVLSIIMFLALTVINARQRAEVMEPNDYVVSASDVTNSPLAATLDPRIDEELAQEQLLVVDEEELAKEQQLQQEEQELDSSKKDSPPTL